MIVLPLAVVEWSWHGLVHTYKHKYTVKITLFPINLNCFSRIKSVNLQARFLDVPQD